MAKYTITIKTLIDNNFDFQLNDYPIFDEDYRSVLNDLILYHYYEDEIGLETPALFRIFLRQKMNEIMPYYNNLYLKQKELLENITNNMNITTTYAGTKDRTDSNTSTTDITDNTNKTNNQTSNTISNTDITDNSNVTNNTSSNGTSNSTNSSNSKNLYQDTPQGNIKNENIDDDYIYATNITLDKNNNSTNVTDNTSSSGTSISSTTNNKEFKEGNEMNISSSSSSINNKNSQSDFKSNGNDNYIKTIVGNNGKKYNFEIMREIKTSLMNIDMLIINELSDLFMGIF